MKPTKPRATTGGRSRFVPVAIAVGALGAVLTFGNLRTTTAVDQQSSVAQQNAPTMDCQQPFDRIAAQKRLMADPALVASRPDPTDVRVTPVEWMMLTDWQRQIITTQNLKLPGNPAACNPGTALDDVIDLYANP